MFFVCFYLFLFGSILFGCFINSSRTGLSPSFSLQKLQYCGTCTLAVDECQIVKILCAWQVRRTDLGGYQKLATSTLANISKHGKSTCSHFNQNNSTNKGPFVGIHVICRESLGDIYFICTLIKH